MAPQPFDKLPSDRTIIRANKRSGHFWNPPDYDEPTGEAFRPNERDKEAREGHPSGVSVFDMAYTSIQEAKAIRIVNNLELTEDDLGILLIEVGTVEQIAQNYGYEVEVLADPITEEPAVHCAGAEGHAVISGMIRKSNGKREKRNYSAMLDDLACSARVVV